MPSLFLPILLLDLPLRVLLVAVVPELARQLVVAGTRSRPVQHHVSPLRRRPELAGEAVLGARQAVAPLRGYFSVVSSPVGPRPWHFVEVGSSLTAAEGAAKVPDAAAFVLGPEVPALLADVEGSFILAWSWHSQLLALILLGLAGEGVGDVVADGLAFVVARAWVGV